MRLQVFWHKLIDIRSADPDEARRQALLNVLLLGTGVVTLFVVAFLAIFLFTSREPGAEGLPDAARPLAGALAVLLGIAIVFALSRRRPGWLPGLLFVVLITFIGSLTNPDYEQVLNGHSLLVFVIPILMASVLLRPWASFVLALAICVGIAIISPFFDITPNPFVFGMFFVIALVSWLAARSLERALADLRQVNRELDQRVEDRTRDLAEALGREHMEASKNQAILLGIADGVLVFDNTGRAVVANPAVSHLLDRPVEAILDRDIESIMGKDVEPEDKELLVELLAARDQHRGSVKVEWGAKTLSLSFAPVQDASGAPTGTVAVLRDFTREAEVDRMKSDFVSIVSHELRTPLTSMKGYLDLVLMGASGPVNMQQSSFLSIARDNAERLNELVADLLDISRIEAGRIDLNVQVVSVPLVIEQVVNSLRKEFSDRGLSLAVDLPPNLPEIFGDPGRIAQIVFNLLSNAYKYTTKGGATVRARPIQGAIQIDVVDTGIGISAQDQERLFSRFFRAEDATVRQQPGTGLGLHITRSLVEMHGGRIWLESQVGVGTVFSFTLPLPAGLVPDIAPPAARAEFPVLPVPAPAPAGLCVLVVDDQPDVARLFQIQLERAGYQVTAITQAGRVVDMARQLRPALITLDLLMDVDGLTVLQQLKADPETRDIPVVVISVMPDAQQSLTRGAADYLIKPLREGELIASVRHILEQLGGGSGKKILVVDDEKDIAGWLKDTLTYYGYQISEAYDGLQALDVVAVDPPDLILLDLRMPRLDGRETIRRLREQDATCHIPIIVLSASQLSETERVQILGLGVQEFLHKTVSVEQLVAEVQRYLSPAAPAPTP